MSKAERLAVITSILGVAAVAITVLLSLCAGRPDAKPRDKIRNRVDWSSVMTFDLTTGMQVLERTPRTLHAMLDGLAPAWLDGAEGAGTWSPFIIVGHLIQAERTNWVPRAQIILERGSDRRFPPFDRLPDADANRAKSIDELLSEFFQVREDSLVRLREWRLTDTQLAFEGEHPEFGAVTLRQLLATWVAHDLSHIAQMSRVMAKQYREAVGPWRAYLRVMDQS